MLYVPLQLDKYENHYLLDTGAIQSVISEAELRKTLQARPEALLKVLPHQTSKFKLRTVTSYQIVNKTYFAST